jgi:hypothetical protein
MLTLASCLISFEKLSEVGTELLRTDPLIEVLQMDDASSLHMVQKFYSYEVLDRSKTATNFKVNRVHAKIVQLLKKCGTIKNKS